MLFALCLLAPAAHADTVTLTGGSASTLAGVGTANLLGSDFALFYAGEIPPDSATSFGINSVTQSLGMPSVTYGGVTSRFFGGSLAFDNSALSATLVAYATMDDMLFRTNPLFTVSFGGTGFLTLTDVGGLTERRFTISAPNAVAAPEPITMLLLGTRLAGAAAFQRRRKSGRQPSPGVRAAGGLAPAND